MRRLQTVVLAGCLLAGGGVAGGVAGGTTGPGARDDSMMSGSTSIHAPLSSESPRVTGPGIVPRRAPADLMPRVLPRVPGPVPMPQARPSGPDPVPMPRVQSPADVLTPAELRPR